MKKLGLTLVFIAFILWFLLLFPVTSNVFLFLMRPDEHRDMGWTAYQGYLYQMEGMEEKLEESFELTWRDGYERAIKDFGEKHNLTRQQINELYSK